MSESVLYFGDSREFELSQIERHPDGTIKRAHVDNGNWWLLIENGVMSVEGMGTMFPLPANAREVQNGPPW